MKRFFAAVTITALLLGGCSAGPAGPGGPPSGPPPAGHTIEGDPCGPRHFTANPTALVAATTRLLSAIRATDEPKDIFRDYFTDDTPVLSSRMTSVENMGLSRETMLLEFLKSDLRRVAISCDGRTGASSGVIETDEMFRSYDLIWQKDEKGQWRVTFVHLDTEAGAEAAPDFIKSSIASCDNRPAEQDEIWTANGIYLGGGSTDGSIRWTVAPHWEGPTTFSIDLWNGNEWTQPFEE